MVSSKFPICLSFILGSLLSSTAQEPELNPVSLQFKIPPAFITGMAQDQKGYIWFTDDGNGLFRYDGMRLVNYKSPSGNLKECITIGRDGKIWVGSYASGLECFDPLLDSFTTFRHDNKNPKSLRSDEIYALATDSSSDGIWIGTNKGLDYYDPKTGEFVHNFTSDPDEDTLKVEFIRTLYVDKKSRLWIGCGNFQSPYQKTTAGLFKLDKKNKTVTRYIHNTDENSLTDNRVSAFFEDTEGDFWVGTGNGGLHLMNRDEGSFKRINFTPTLNEPFDRAQNQNAKVPGSEQIIFITEDNKGFIWITTFSNGVAQYDPIEKESRHYGKNETGKYRLNTDNFWTGLKTRDGLIWISGFLPASTDGVLLKINPVPKRMTRASVGQIMGCFAGDQSGNTYMGGAGMVMRMDKSGNLDTLNQLNGQLPIDTPIIHLEIDSQENLWISTYRGLFKYNLLSKKLRVYRSDPKTGLENDAIYTTLALNQNTILVGTENGVFQLDLLKDQFKKYHFSDSNEATMGSHGEYKFLVDSKKNTWVGGYDGLYKLNQAKLMFTPYKLSGNPAGQIQDIYEDPTSGLYVGTKEHGLWRFDNTKDQFELATDGSGFLDSNTTVWAIGSEKNDRLYIETNDGIVKYNTGTKASAIYGNSWGYVAWAVINKFFYRSSRGEYYKGTSSGYLKFDPSIFEKGNYQSNLPFVGRILVNNQLVNGVMGENNNLNLKYFQNNISLEIGFIDFLANNYDQQIQYKLENYDESWRSGENGSKVYYYKTPPGSYLFRLRGMDFYGDWHEITIPIVITPPWYGTWWAITLFVLLFIAAIRAYVVYRNRKLRAEKKVLEQKVKERTTELEESLETVRSTQSQLIQSEKMASLGELTAGIAHEIQNPLNFVNNFSEVNRELLDEAATANETGNQSELRELLQDLKNNQEKIKQHGDRADAIVKSMLQHSRTSSGKKELTDINALCDEYLRIAYHGMRAKDSSFNVKLETHLDHSLSKIKVVPQELGRVLLNILNNSFHTVTEKAHLNEAGYIPEVKISTASLNNKIEIKVRDNGMGIPEKIKEKIFQPFFTTKPAGQGTGLGLSLTYDIIKAHGGEIMVNSKEGEGTEFTISLPAV